MTPELKEKIISAARKVCQTAEDNGYFSDKKQNPFFRKKLDDAWDEFISVLDEVIK